MKQQGGGENSRTSRQGKGLPSGRGKAEGPSTEEAARDPPRQLAFEEVPPLADALAESLRAFGYTLPNAISDLVDNSLTATAKRLDIEGWWAGSSSWVRVRDDGRGMPEAKLIEAMRPGTLGPDAPRDPKDLGRFGLGLKTASFSQCRILTVRSRAAGFPEATRCWDLDYVRETHLWRLLREPREPVGTDVLGHFGDNETGTAVLWQSMDKVVGPAPASDAKAHADFVGHLQELAAHLAVVFHRFLSGSDGITITVNGQVVRPWDPFLEGEPFTQHEPVERFGNGDRTIEVRPFILPHQSKMGSMRAFEAAAGPEGWNAQQGFYIYRNARLIVSGGWLGMYHAEENYKLARIQVDVGNALDQEWQLDVRKARARPPDRIRSELKRIADKTRRLAKEVYVHRGQVIVREGSSLESVYVWQPIRRDVGTSYRVNRTHPLIISMLDAAESRVAGERALRLLEETLPIQHILAKFDEHARQQAAPFEGPSATEVEALVSESARILAGKGLRGADLRRALMLLEPFQHYPEVVERVADAFARGEGDHGA
jgi:hypothetical protein